MSEVPRSDNLPIEYWSVDQIKDDPRSPRRHSRGQIGKVQRSIACFGVVVPLLARPDGTLINGHAVIAAARLAGVREVPVVVCRGLNEPSIRALSLALNRTAEDAGWDKEALRLAFVEIEAGGLDLSITGFDAAEIDMTIEAQAEPIQTDDVDLVLSANRDQQAITRPGELICLGRHRLFCGNALEREVYPTLLGERMADLVLTDPPYNVAIQGHVGGRGRVRHAEFAMASGEMNTSEFTAFLTQSLTAALPAVRDGAVLFVFMDHRHQLEMMGAIRQAQLTYLNTCVWTKSSPGQGSFYRSAHEFCYVLRKGDTAHLNNVQLGKFGRSRTNVWSARGMAGFGAGRDELLRAHPTVKPIGLIEDAIRDASRRGEIVLDPFCGSGTTILACENTARIGRGVELDPYYCDVIIRRWQGLTRGDAIFEATGETFTERLNRAVVASESDDPQDVDPQDADPQDAAPSSSGT